MRKYLSMLAILALLCSPVDLMAGKGNGGGGGGGKPNQVTLSVSVSPSSIGEGLTATGTVSHNGPTSSDVIVSLSSSDTSEAIVDDNLTILSGSNSATFTITTIDDEEADGNQAVTIFVAASGFDSDSTVLTVESERPQLPAYVVTVFDNLGGQAGRFFSVNKQGDAVGTSGVSSTHAHATYAPVDAFGLPIAMIDLNDLIDPLSGIELNAGYDINERDMNGNSQIVGWGTDLVTGMEFPFRLTPPANSTLVQEPDGKFIYKSSNGDVVYPTVITLLLPGSVNGTGFGINNSGDVVGDNWLPNGDHFGFIYTDQLGLMALPVDLGTDFRQTQGLNDALQITGEMSSGTFREAYQYSFLDDQLKPLGVISLDSNPSSTGWDINEAGTVVGESSSTIVIKRKTYSVDRAFRVVDGGIMEDLGTLGGENSRAYGINSQGDIVGWSDVVSDRNGYPIETAPFLYLDAFGEMVNLESLVVNSVSRRLVPDRISDTGVICGMASGAEIGLESKPFILTPLP